MPVAQFHTAWRSGNKLKSLPACRVEWTAVPLGKDVSPGLLAPHTITPRVVESREFTFAFFHLGQRGLVSPKEQPSGGHSSAGRRGRGTLYQIFTTRPVLETHGHHSDPQSAGRSRGGSFSPFQRWRQTCAEHLPWGPWFPLWRPACPGRQLPGLGRGAAACTREVKQNAHPWPWHEAPAHWCVKSKIL